MPTNPLDHPPPRACTRRLVLSRAPRRPATDEAFRTLALHAELDPEHGDEINLLLDDLVLTPEQSEVLALSAMYTVHMLARATDEAIEEFEQSLV